MLIEDLLRASGPSLEKQFRKVADFRIDNINDCLESARLCVCVCDGHIRTELETI